MTENPKSNAKYKTIRDLADYLNDTGKFKRRVVQQDVFKAFENAGLFIRNPEDNRLYPSEFVTKSGGCFVTKGKVILFTKQFFDLMTKDTKVYSAYDWLEWFVNMHNQDSISDEVTVDSLNGISKDEIRNALTIKIENDLDDDDWTCGCCGKTVDSIYNVREWCELNHINSTETKKQLDTEAIKRKFDSDMCEDCFNSLLKSVQIQEEQKLTVIPIKKLNRYLVKIKTKWIVVKANSKQDVFAKYPNLKKILKLN